MFIAIIYIKIIDSNTFRFVRGHHQGVCTSNCVQTASQIVLNSCSGSEMWTVVRPTCGCSNTELRDSGRPVCLCRSVLCQRATYSCTQAACVISSVHSRVKVYRDGTVPHCAPCCYTCPPDRHLPLAVMLSAYEIGGLVTHASSM
jgi:hypothetical protein